MFGVKCTACGESAKNLLDYECPSCSKPLDVKLNVPFEVRKIGKKDYSLWRYARFFPYVEKGAIMTLGEGWTPHVKFSKNVYFKLENLNPTGSFKDRGSSILVSAVHNHVRKTEGFIAEDSSGNAGASIAAYAARAGLKARIYVPEAVSGPKFNQIRFYGAEVVKVSGTRSKVAEEAQKPEHRKYYVGHILHPLFRDGIRSLAYEIVEQSDWNAPEYVYLPVSAGTLLLGVIEGFTHLAKSNIIDHVPKIVACQTRQVSPLYHRLKNLSYMPPKQMTSIADALVSVEPPLLDLMVKQLKSAKGSAEIVEEAETLGAFKELAAKGFFVEPSSAVAYAAYKKQLQNGEVPKDNSAIIVLTGNGLKSGLRPD
jgi:threonine synthase